MVVDLTEGSVPKRLVQYAIPFVFSNLLQIVYNLVDTIVVGHFVGPAGLSGVSLAGQITQMCTALTMGMVTGAQVMIAQFMGARKRDDVNYTIGTMAVYGGLIALIMSILGILTSSWGLHLIKTPEEAFAEAQSYEIIIFIGLVFNCGYMTVSAILRGMGDSKRPLMFVTVSSICNVVLDLLFVGVFKLQAAGAALATIISYFISFVFAIRYIYVHREGFGLDFKLKYFKIRWDLCWTITKLGVPMALQWIIFSLSSLYVQSLVNVYGLAASAAVAVGSKASNMTNIISGALGNSCTTMAGQNIAAQKIDRVKKCVNVTLTINLLWMGLCVLLLQLFPRQYVLIFNDDPEVIQVATMYLRIMSISYLFHACYIVYNGVILGVGNSMLNMANALLEGIVLKITLSLLFGTVLGWGLKGVFVGQALAPLGAALSGGIYYYSGMWKRRKLIAKRDAEPVETEETT